MPGEELLNIARPQTAWLQGRGYHTHPRNRRTPAIWRGIQVSGYASLADLDRAW